MEHVCRGKRTCCFIWGLLTLVLLIVAVVFIILTAQAWQRERTMGNERDCHETVDVAVIGAGMGGTYMAWRLKQRHPQWNIALYEATDRLGGRVYTVDIPGTDAYKAELGAMRFRSSHTHFMDLLEELGLSYSPFTTVGARERIYYLRGQHLTQDDFKNGSVPYNLRNEEQNQYSTQLLYYYNRLLVDNTVPEDQVFDRKTKDGRLLFNIGHNNALDEVASQEGINFVQDTMGLKYPLDTNENYAWWSPLELHDQPDYDGMYYKVDQGFQAVVDKMADEFKRLSGKDAIYTGYKLDAIDSSSPENAKLYFEMNNDKQKDDKIICAKKVILGIPKAAMIDIKWAELRRDPIQHMLQGAINVPAVKMVFAYDTPWWKSVGNGPIFDQIKQENIDLKLVITDLPLRQVYDAGYDVSTHKAILIVSYSDWWPAIHYWRYLIEGSRDPDVKLKGGHYNVTDDLIRMVNVQFSQIFNVTVDKIPIPVFTSAYAWHDAPYWGGWHVWAPGYRYDELQRGMLKPLDKRQIYVVGEAWSFGKGWVEGALETANNSLEKYF